LCPGLALAGATVKKMNKRILAGETDEAMAIAEDYLKTRPGGDEADEVTELLAQLLFQRAQQLGTEEAYLDFTKRFPESPMHRQALEAAARERWKAVLAEDSREAYLQYLAAYPGSAHASEAIAREDERAWAEAVDSDDMRAYFAYQDEHPHGRYLDEAAQLGKNRAMVQARSEDSAETWAWVAERFGETPEGREARWQVLRLQGKADFGGSLKGNRILANPSRMSANWTQVRAVPAGTPVVIDLGMDWPPEAQPQVDLLGALRSGTGAARLVPATEILHGLMRRLGTLAALPNIQPEVERLSPRHLRLKSPIPLRKDPGNDKHEGFAISISPPSASQGNAVLMPFRIVEPYPAESGARQVLLFLDTGDIQSFDPQTRRVRRITTDANLVGYLPVTAERAIGWNEQNAFLVDLDSGGIQTIDGPGRVAEAEAAAGGSVVLSTTTGLYAVDPFLNVAQLLPGGRPGLPFRLSAYGGGVFYERNGQLSVWKRGSEPRPIGVQPRPGGDGLGNSASEKWSADHRRFLGFRFAPSPDGATLAYTRWMGDMATVVMRDLDTGRERTLFSERERSLMELGWTEDGMGIVATLRDANGEHIELHALDSSEGPEVRAGDRLLAISGTLSTSGNRPLIARWTGRIADLFSEDSVSNLPVQLTNTRSLPRSSGVGPKMGGEGIHGMWAPDGYRLLYIPVLSKEAGLPGAGPLYATIDGRPERFVVLSEEYVSDFPDWTWTHWSLDHRYMAFPIWKEGPHIRVLYEDLSLHDVGAGTQPTWRPLALADILAR
jgi:hypothetical protein